MTNSRKKGADFERALANALFDETGIAFKRELNQYREKDLGDLIPNNDNWPFLIECKRYAKGDGCKTKWFFQAEKAARKAGKFPVVIYKYDNKEIRCTIGVDVIGDALGLRAVTHYTADVSLEAFCFIAREIMNNQKRRGNWE
tara:strand:+ start:679 stop:1107 length:429 start_codon:yes stop_codon:yes gene_type:complete